MKTRKSIFNALLCLALAYPGALLASKGAETELSKSVKKSFSVDDNVNLEVTNKYGQVVVNTWDKDSVTIDIKVTAIGKNDDAVEKLLDRVDFDFSNVGTYLTVETVLDRKSGTLAELWKTISDRSKALLSKSKLKVDYKVNMPRNANITVENKFGDLYLSDLDGKSVIDLAHGSLKAGSLNGYTRIDLSFGDANIKSLKEGQMDLKAAEADITEAKQLDIKSMSSEIIIQKSDNLQLGCRNDKVRVEEAIYVRGQGSFSHLEIISLEETVDLNLTYGTVHVQRVSPVFSLVDIRGKSTDILVEFDQLSDASIYLEGDKEKVSVPDQLMSDLEQELDEKEKVLSYTGELGDNNSKRKIKIQARGGDLRVNTLDAIINKANGQ